VSKKKKILLLKATALVAMCCTLTGCEVFCICAEVLVFSQLQLTQPNLVPSTPAFWFFELLAECADPLYSGADVCPASGFQTETLPGPDGFPFIKEVPCTPGTIDPLAPSLVPTQPSTNSGEQNVVESTPFTLPQSPPRPQGITTRRSPIIDCTAPANAGRPECTGTYRENKPRVTHQ
jgi:hypothetical protein